MSDRDTFNIILFEKYIHNLYILQNTGKKYNIYLLYSND